jgi:hypothetical protein
MIDQNREHRIGSLALGQREPDLAKAQDQADLPDRRRGIAPPAGHPSHRSYEAKLVVIAQRAGGYAGAFGQLAGARQT